MAMKVEFLGGQSAYSDKAVNYMLAEFPEVTLYAEVEIPECENPDEYGYDELKESIIHQAITTHINPDSLEFWWD